VEPSGDLVDALRPKPPQTPEFAHALHQGFIDRERVLIADVGEIKL
jgi:hypothetical protein